ncbi:MAG: hypothetical protein KBC17_02110 [Candidatus Pacebacteria bacterium]|nr:hypothetical protein [Candidatus Paceibacterota bacterium]
MAITTLDNAINNMGMPIEITKSVTGTIAGGRPQSLFYLAGNPPAATAPSTGLVGAALTTYAGQIPFTNPSSGNTYLARFQAQATQAGTLLLCDRLWHNSGIDVTNTSEQTFTSSVQIPARDANGTNNGVGVYAAIETSATTGAGAPTITLKYTNSSGTADQTGTNILATSTTVGAFYPIGLATGDVGVQKAQSITLSGSWTSGKIHVVLYRVIARLEILPNTQSSAIDALTAGFPRVYDNSVPFLVFIPNTTTTSNITGQVIWTQG